MHVAALQVVVVVCKRERWHPKHGGDAGFEQLGLSRLFHKYSADYLKIATRAWRAMALSWLNCHAGQECITHRRGLWKQRARPLLISADLRDNAAPSKCTDQIGRASGRERGCPYGEIPVGA